MTNVSGTLLPITMCPQIASRKASDLDPAAHPGRQQFPVMKRTPPPPQPL